ERAAFDQENSFATWRQPIGQGPATRTGPDNDEIEIAAVVHARLVAARRESLRVRPIHLIFPWEAWDRCDKCKESQTSATNPQNQKSYANHATRSSESPETENALFAGFQ